MHRTHGPIFVLTLGLAACGGDGGGAADDARAGSFVDEAVRTANEAVAEALAEAGLGEPVDYELSMERVRDWRRAVRRLEELDLGRDDSIELNAEDSSIVDELQAALEEDPRIVEVIEDAGLGTREFAIISVLLPQALTVHEMRAAGLNTSLPMVTDRHLAFVAEHEAELKAVLDDGERR